MPTGVIKVFKYAKNFGFIQPDGTEDELFFHLNSMVPGSPQPRIGDKVTYDTVEGNKDLNAINVKKQTRKS